MSNTTIGPIGPPHAHGVEPREEIQLAAARRNGWPELNALDWGRRLLALFGGRRADS